MVCLDFDAWHYVKLILSKSSGSFFDIGGLSFTKARKGGGILNVLGSSFQCVCKTQILAVKRIT
jgi:hypothetical protein